MVQKLERSEVYEKKWQTFLDHMKRVNAMQPRENFLYPIMDKPVFSDLQTAMMMAELEYKKRRK